MTHRYFKYFKYDTIFASDLCGIYNGSPCKSHTDRPLILYLYYLQFRKQSHMNLFGVEFIWTTVTKTLKTITMHFFWAYFKTLFPKNYSFVLIFFINYCMEVKNLI